MNNLIDAMRALDLTLELEVTCALGDHAATDSLRMEAAKIEARRRERIAEAEKNIAEAARETLARSQNEC